MKGGEATALAHEIATILWKTDGLSGPDGCAVLSMARAWSLP
jgi:hypothetical protein